MIDSSLPVGTVRVFYLPESVVRTSRRYAVPLVPFFRDAYRGPRTAGRVHSSLYVRQSTSYIRLDFRVSSGARISHGNQYPRVPPASSPFFPFFTVLILVLVPLASCLAYRTSRLAPPLLDNLSTCLLARSLHPPALLCILPTPRLSFTEALHPTPRPSSPRISFFLFFFFYSLPVRVPLASSSIGRFLFLRRSAAPYSITRRNVPHPSL